MTTLTELRTRAALSQQALADRLYTTRQAISRTERAPLGTLSLETLRNHLKALGYPTTTVTFDNTITATDTDNIPITLADPAPLTAGSFVRTGDHIDFLLAYGSLTMDEAAAAALHEELTRYLNTGAARDRREHFFNTIADKETITFEFNAGGTITPTITLHRTNIDAIASLTAALTEQ